MHFPSCHNHGTEKMVVKNHKSHQISACFLLQGERLSGPLFAVKTVEGVFQIKYCTRGFHSKTQGKRPK
jgi:hypothetical protein